MADALHVVIETDRTVYTRQVVNRLVKEDKVIKASEHWQDEKALPLPAQMFRMGAGNGHGEKHGLHLLSALHVACH
jgi:hypothetical protein